MASRIRGLGVACGLVLGLALVADVRAAEPSYEAAVEAIGASDYKTAFANLLPLAEKGDPNAQFTLAFLYDFGQGVEESPEAAAYWYGQASLADLPVAQFTLAGMYEIGHGVPKDPVRAYYWYSRAIDNLSAGETRETVSASRDAMAERLSDAQLAQVEAGINNELDPASLLPGRPGEEPPELAVTQTAEQLAAEPAPTEEASAAAEQTVPEPAPTEEVKVPAEPPEPEAASTAPASASTQESSASAEQAAAQRPATSPPPEPEVEAPVPVAEPEITAEPQTERDPVVDVAAAPETVELEIVQPDLERPPEVTPSADEVAAPEPGPDSVTPAPRVARAEPVAVRPEESAAEAPGPETLDRTVARVQLAAAPAPEPAEPVDVELIEAEPTPVIAAEPAPAKAPEPIESDVPAPSAPEPAIAVEAVPEPAPEAPTTAAPTGDEPAGAVQPERAGEVRPEPETAEPAPDVASEPAPTAAEAPEPELAAAIEPEAREPEPALAEAPLSEPAEPAPDVAVAPVPKPEPQTPEPEPEVSEPSGVSLAEILERQQREGSQTGSEPSGAPEVGAPSTTQQAALTDEGEQSSEARAPLSPFAEETVFVLERRLVLLSGIAKDLETPSAAAAGWQRLESWEIETKRLLETRIGQGIMFRFNAARDKALRAGDPVGNVNRSIQAYKGLLIEVLESIRSNPAAYASAP